MLRFFYELHCELFFHIQLTSQLPKAGQCWHQCLHHLRFVSWTVDKIWAYCITQPEDLDIWQQVPVLQSCADDVNVVNQAKNPTQGHVCQHLNNNSRSSPQLPAFDFLGKISDGHVPLMCKSQCHNPQQSLASPPVFRMTLRRLTYAMLINGMFV